MSKVLCATKALIVKDGKFLMIKQRSLAGYDYIDLPGGRMDFGLSPEENLTREVKEEIFLDVKIKKIIGTWHFFIPKEEGQIQVICITYLCKPLTDKVDLTKNPDKDENIFEYSWITPEEFLKLEEPHNVEDFERLKNLIRKYFSK